MGKFTKYGDKEDKRIREELNKICRVIKRYSNPISIILTGGFGRGEGSIIYKNKEFIAINDYDIYVITNRKIPNKILERMSVEASKSIDKKCINFSEFSSTDRYSIEETFYPDIRNLTLKELRKLPPFVKYFEIKYGSSVIDGREILGEIPEFPIENVVVQDGFRFLMNRMALMIMHFSPKFMKKMDVNDKEEVVNFTMKSALTCAEALLLLSKKFVASYEKRSKILKKTYEKDFPELSRRIPDLPKFVEKYTDFKLKPNYQSIKKPIEDWFKAREYAGEILRYYLYKFTLEYPEDWYGVAQNINKKYWKHYLKDYISAFLKIKKPLASLLVVPGQIFLNLLFIRRIWGAERRLHLRSLFYFMNPPDLKLFSATPLVISALKENGEIDFSKFDKAKKYLDRIYPSKIKIKDWEAMRNLHSTIFRLYGFQKLV